MKDGWHTILGYEVYVENNKVLRGTLGEGVTYRPAYPYRWDRTSNCWIQTIKMNINTFRNGINRETVKMA